MRLKRAGLLFLLGSLLGLCQWSYPVLKSLIFLTLPALFFFTPKTPLSLKARFWEGWILTLGYFSIALYWIPNALYVHYETFYWAIPFAFFGIPAACAFVFAVSALLFPWQKYEGIMRILVFSAFWMAGEGLLNVPFGGFPWALLGYTWITPLSIAQISNYISVYGLSFLTLIFGSCFYALKCLKTRQKRVFLALFYAFLGCFLLVLGHFSLKKPSKLEAIPPLRLIQPNIPQEKKWAYAHQHKNLHTLVRLSYEPALTKAQLVIWPESALTFSPSERLFKYITSPLTHGQYLITGLLADEKDSTYNGLVVFNHDGTRVQHYHKHHLVPFGEYIPFYQTLMRLLPFEIHALTHIKTTPGSGPKTLSLPGIEPFSPQICFESLFASSVSSGSPKPQWILNLTNDAWFGNSQGPKQHLTITRFRAIQAGMPLVRAASTGISAIIDAQGRIVKKLEYGIPGVIENT